MMPAAVIPVVSYPDIHAAADWLVDVFGFQRRLIVFDHRVQMSYGDGNLVLTDKLSPSPSGFNLTLRVEDCSAVCERARERGAEITLEPTDFFYGERQCDLVDPWKVRWMLSQTVADIDPAEWGGVLVNPRRAVAESRSRRQSGQQRNSIFEILFPKFDPLFFQIQICKHFRVGVVWSLIQKQLHMDGPRL